ncbi:MAG TPA: hypothetical protein ENI97_03260 [Gammaproteobacteria bacterium]|nr:hypothetical protein [Gammaproteobacteria bacterium]
MLYDALVHSYNIATARLGLALGVPAVTDTLRALGAERPFSDYPSLLLGAVNFSPLEVTQMYHTLAAGGFRTPLRAIRAVLTADGRPLQRYPLSVTRVVDHKPLYLLNSALRGVTREGTGRGVQAYLPAGMVVAGKTGTSDELRDSWFAGFSENYVAAVWLGLDDNRPAGLTGARGALRVWGDMLSRLETHSLSAAAPDGVDTLWVDQRNGLRSDDDCPYSVQLPFIAGSQPGQHSACELEVMDE